MNEMVLVAAIVIMFVVGYAGVKLLGGFFVNHLKHREED